MEDSCCAETSCVEEIFASEKVSLSEKESIAPEVIDEIKKAIIALEAQLAKTFPKNKTIQSVLGFLATYLNWLL